MEGEKIMEKAKKDIFDKFPDVISLAYWHDEGLEVDGPTKEAILARCKEEFGAAPQPALYHPFIIEWSVKGVGFGEYAFWMKDGKIHCDNEAMSRESVKRVLCMMVDQAVFPGDEPKG